MLWLHGCCFVCFGFLEAFGFNSRILQVGCKAWTFRRQWKWKVKSLVFFVKCSKTSDVWTSSRGTRFERIGSRSCSALGIERLDTDGRALSAGVLLKVGGKLEESWWECVSKQANQAKRQQTSEMDQKYKKYQEIWDQFLSLFERNALWIMTSGLYVLIILTALCTKQQIDKSLLRFLGFNIFQQRSPSCLAEVQVAPTCNGEAMIQVMKREKLLDMLDGQKLSTRSASTLVTSSVMSEDDVSWWGIRLMNVDE